MVTFSRWLHLLPFIRFTRADVLTLVLFVTLGPLSGMLLFGFCVSGLNGALGTPILFVLGMAVLPKAAVMVVTLMGMLPAYAGGLAALAVRGFDRPFLYAICAMAAGCEVQLLVLSPLLLPGKRAELFIAAAGAAAICAAASYRIRAIKS
jgi:hypothetical protein